MSTLGPSKPCPCGSGATYGACCRPAHRRERAPATAEALMRSRYSAFALGEIDYLIHTLATAHPDREEDPTALRIALREVCRTGRFMGLTVYEAHEEGERATVRFRARVFSGGVDRSFEETSDFVRERDGWRYLGAHELK